jgi:hypothetical protein
MDCVQVPEFMSADFFHLFWSERNEASSTSDGASLLRKKKPGTGNLVHQELLAVLPIFGLKLNT